MPEPPSFDYFAAAGAQRLAWSPDGHTIALGGQQLRLFDPTDGTTRWETTEHGTSALTFSPDGRLLAACDIDGGTVSITMFDAAAGQPQWPRSRSHTAIKTGPGPSYDPDNPVGSFIRAGMTGILTGLGLGLLQPVLEGVARTRFSPDSRLVAFAGLVLDAGTGKDAVTVPPGQEAARSPASEVLMPMPPAFSPDSRAVAVQAGNQITVIDTDTGNVRWTAPCPSNPAWARFADGDLIVVCDPAIEILRFDATTGEPAATRLLDPPAPGFTIPFIQDPPGIFDLTPDGRSLVAVGGGIGQDKVIVYDTSTGTARFPAVKITRALTGSGSARGVLSPFGERIAVSSPGLTTLRTRSGTIDWEQPSATVADLSFHPWGAKLAALVDDQLRVYDTGLMESPIGIDSPVDAISVSGGGLPLLALAGQQEDGHGVAYLFQAALGTIVLEKSDLGLIKAMQLSPTGQKLATGRTSGVVTVYDTLSQSQWLAMRQGRSVNDLVFDDSGALLATASNDKTARLIDVATKSERWSVNHPAAVTHVALDPYGRWMATACDDHVTRILETGRGTPIAQFPLAGRVIAGKVQALTAARERPLVAVAYDGAVLVIDAADGTLIGQVEHSRPVAAAVLNASGNLLASGGRDERVRISLVASSEVVTDLSIPTGSEVIELAFNPADGLLAAATYDGAVHVLDPRSGDELIRLPHPTSLTGIAFSPDGSLLAVGCKDHFAYVYRTGWS